MQYDEADLFWSRGLQALLLPQRPNLASVSLCLSTMVDAALRLQCRFARRRVHSSLQQLRESSAGLSYEREAQRPTTCRWKGQRKRGRASRRIKKSAPASLKLLRDRKPPLEKVSSSSNLRRHPHCSTRFKMREKRKKDASSLSFFLLLPRRSPLPASPSKAPSLAHFPFAVAPFAQRVLLQRITFMVAGTLEK